MKIDFAGDGRDADAVAIMRDARDDLLEQIPVARVVERSKAQGVEERDRAGAHREDVTQDAANACGRALKRLDSGRMIVGFDLKTDAEVIVERDHARIFERAGLLRLFIVLE